METKESRAVVCSAVMGSQPNYEEWKLDKLPNNFYQQPGSQPNYEEWKHFKAIQILYHSV